MRIKLVVGGGDKRMVGNGGVGVVGVYRAKL